MRILFLLTLVALFIAGAVYLVQRVKPMPEVPRNSSVEVPKAEVPEWPCTGKCS